MEFDRQEHNAMTDRCKRIMINFIEATRSLIQTEGVDGLSIRKIANEAGYNSATLYNYFRDLEHLTLFGSVCYLRDYIVELGKSLDSTMSSLDRFRTIYRCFNGFAFRYPDIFHNMFFGRYSDLLEDVLHTYYYELFPQEMEGIDESLRRMLVSGNMQSRDRVNVEAMVRDGFIAQEKAEPVLCLIEALEQQFVYEACLGVETSRIPLMEARFNELFEYLLMTAK